MFYPYEGYRSVTPLDAARDNRTIFHNHSARIIYMSGSVNLRRVPPRTGSEPAESTYNYSSRAKIKIFQIVGLPMSYEARRGGMQSTDYVSEHAPRGTAYGLPGIIHTCRYQISGTQGTVSNSGTWYVPDARYSAAFIPLLPAVNRSSARRCVCNTIRNKLTTAVIHYQVLI